MNELITTYWRDIPAQIVGRKGRKTVVKAVLNPRFQDAIDRAAMRAGRGSSDKYLEDWRRASRPCGEDIEREVKEEVVRLEGLFSKQGLDTLAQAGGREISEQSDPEAETGS